MGNLSIVVKKLVLCVTHKTKGMIIVIIRLLRLANEENMPQVMAFQQQQMQSKYNFWGSINCQWFCSLTYPTKIAEKQEERLTWDQVPNVDHFEMKAG